MKSLFYKFTSFLIMGFTVVTFGSYSNNDNGDNTPTKITATGIRVNSATTVKAYSIRNNVIAEAPFQNNSFILELPATMPPDFLFPVLERVSRSRSVSDYSAQISAPIALYGYNEAGYRIGSFSLTYTRHTRTSVIDIGSFEVISWIQTWMYADRDVTIREEHRINNSSTLIYDLNLKGGWNIVYLGISVVRDNDVNTVIHTHQSQNPGNFNFSWRFTPEAR
jgi:hypothetical protein